MGFSTRRDEGSVCYLHLVAVHPGNHQETGKNISQCSLEKLRRLLHKSTFPEQEGQAEAFRFWEMVMSLPTTKTSAALAKLLGYGVIASWHLHREPILFLCYSVLVIAELVDNMKSHAEATPSDAQDESMK